MAQPDNDSLAPADIDAMPDYSDAQLLKLYRRALVDLADTGKAVGARGNILTRADEKFCRDTIDWLEQRVSQADLADNSMGGVSLAVFVRPR